MIQVIMNKITEILEYIIPKTLELNQIYITSESTRVNYSAIFCQNETEYEELNREAAQFGDVVEDTPTGPLYKFHKPLQTIAGPLWLLKVRKLDLTRPERGDADFTLQDYNSFKEKYLKDTKHFKLIDRGNFEMIELRDPMFDVISYFSNIPLTVQLGI
ncbi:MAG: hypothetical protein C0412_15220 [Flavobacterium sp.]|nr:hypothetical protein [Flavobacterium sp.]